MHYYTHMIISVSTVINSNIVTNVIYDASGDKWPV